MTCPTHGTPTGTTGCALCRMEVAVQVHHAAVERLLGPLRPVPAKVAPPKVERKRA